jgi:hypothetical protein
MVVGDPGKMLAWSRFVDFEEGLGFFTFPIFLLGIVCVFGMVRQSYYFLTENYVQVILLSIGVPALIKVAMVLNERRDRQILHELMHDKSDAQVRKPRAKRSGRMNRSARPDEGLLASQRTQQRLLTQRRAQRANKQQPPATEQALPDKPEQVQQEQEQAQEAQGKKRRKCKGKEKGYAKFELQAEKAKKQARETLRQEALNQRMQQMQEAEAEAEAARRWEKEEQELRREQERQAREEQELEIALLASKKEQDVIMAAKTEQHATEIDQDDDLLLQATNAYQMENEMKADKRGSGNTPNDFVTKYTQSSFEK